MIIEVLTKQQIEIIHNKSLEILEKIGVHIPHDDVVSLFVENGANVDLNKKNVKIPPELVIELLSKAGKTFTIYGRDLSKKAEFGTGKRNYNTSSGQAFWVENPGEERRHTTLNDVKTAVRFADALDQINIPGAMSDPLEIPVEWRCVAVAAEMIKNTEKPINFWFYDRNSAKYLVDLVIALRGDEKKAEKYPMFYHALEPISPLSFPFNGIDLLFETARLNMPVHLSPMVQMGISGPGTIAGTIIQENAEVITAICITQLIKKGMPICYGGICHAFDMRSAQIIFGGPEQAIFSVAMTQMGKYYGFPVYINAGLTDSKVPDAQAGLECGVTLSLGLLSGADIFGHMGICGMDQGASLDMLVLQSEIISYIESVNREIIFDDNTFALDIIAQTGPQGSYLKNRHTAKNIRKELWFPEIFNRESYEKWKKNGALDIAEHCRNVKKQIITNHIPNPIANDIANDIDTIVNSARKNLTSLAEIK